MDFAVSPKDNRARLDGGQLAGTEKLWDAREAGVWSVRAMEFKVGWMGAGRGRSHRFARQAKQTESNKGLLEGGQLCVSARRNTAALGVELSLPMGVSAVVMLCAQFAGKWRMQVYVKLFALLVQVLAFQTLVPNEALSIATTMPRVCECRSVASCLARCTLHTSRLVLQLHGGHDAGQPRPDDGAVGAESALVCGATTAQADAAAPVSRALPAGGLGASRGGARRRVSTAAPGRKLCQVGHDQPVRVGAGVWRAARRSVRARRACLHCRRLYPVFVTPFLSSTSEYAAGIVKLPLSQFPDR